MIVEKLLLLNLLHFSQLHLFIPLFAAERDYANDNRKHKQPSSYKITVNIQKREAKPCVKIKLQNRLKFFT